MKKTFILFLFISLVLIPVKHSFGATTMTGFIPGQIWYSPESFIEGDTVKIYTALWNNGVTPLSAKVEFYDKNVVLGSRDVVVPASQLQEVSVSWKVTSGDHLISAKIVSPSITVSGKKQNISVNNSITEADKRFVPVVINTIDGTPVSSAEIIKSQVDKATSSLSDILPDSINTSAEKSVGALDSFRSDTFSKISETKATTEKRVEELKKTPEKVSSTNTKVGIEDATEKPIAYLKLFFLSVLSFIFGSKLVFYLLLLVIIFFISRSIYRKIRNR